MVAHINGKRRPDAFYAETGPHAGLFRGVILQYRSPPGVWDITWRSDKWYASAQQARGVASNHLRKA